MATATSSVPPPRSWWSRHWKWFLPLAILVLLAVAAGIGWYAAGGKLKWSEPYLLALKQVQKDPQVIDRPGAPVRDATWLPSGSMTVGGNRETSLMFHIAGPKGAADVQLRARQVGGQWGGTITVMLGGRDRINVDLGEGDEAPKFNADGGEAPKFNPPAPSGPDIRVEVPK